MDPLLSAQAVAKIAQLRKPRLWQMKASHVLSRYSDQLAQDLISASNEQAIGIVSRMLEENGYCPRTGCKLNRAAAAIQRARLTPTQQGNSTAMELGNPTPMQRNSNLTPVQQGDPTPAQQGNPTPSQPGNPASLQHTNPTPMHSNTVSSQPVNPAPLQQRNPTPTPQRNPTPNQQRNTTPLQRISTPRPSEYSNTAPNQQGSATSVQNTSNPPPTGPPLAAAAMDGAQTAFRLRFGNTGPTPSDPAITELVITWQDVLDKLWYVAQNLLRCVYAYLQPRFGWLLDPATTSAPDPVRVKPCKLDAVFMCPITQEVMEDPVVAADGFTYERSAIETWLSTHDTSPMTNMRLAHRNLTRNFTLRSAIREYHTAQGLASNQ